jgi:hypothetical protein
MARATTRPQLHHVDTMLDAVPGARPLLVVAYIAVVGAFGASPALASAAFGLRSLSAEVSTLQAGAHADFSTSLALNTEALGNPAGQLRTTSFTLPAGLVGNPQAIESCSILALQSLACGGASQIGELTVTAVQCRGTQTPLVGSAEAGTRTLTVANANAFCAEAPSNVITVGTGEEAETAEVIAVVNATTLELAGPLEHAHLAGEPAVHIANTSTESIPLFNVQPTPGHIATFAASQLLADIFIQVGLGGGGRLTATISETSTLAQVLASKVTLWGVPADPSHDALRCNEFNSKCGPSAAGALPFMTNPTSCSASPQEEVTATSWQGQSASSVTTLPLLTGCEQLKMSPSLVVAPSTTRQDSPAGYEIVVQMPQSESPYRLATPALEQASISLPQGTSLSPGLGNGLLACSPEQLDESRCPDASQIGTAEIATPLIAEPLKGALYMGTPTPTERYRVFLRVDAGSTVIALQGDVEANEVTGQTSTTFEDLPELPMATLRLRFFGGATAALANPQTCGPATSSARAISDAGQLISISSTFEVDEGAEGGACQSPLPFAPSFTAGTTEPLAGHASPFVLSVSRTDGQQDLSSFTARLPPGLSGLMSTVPVCREPAAGTGGCPHASEVGTASVAAGAGPMPLVMSGPVYLTGPYDGAPLGLDMVVNASAGPFAIGTALVRSRILLNPSSLALTIASDSLPQIVDGIPLRVRAVAVRLDRSRFIVNPTSCAQRMLTATIDPSQGTAVALSTPFVVVGCADLTFKPHLAASTAASQQGNGANLDIELTNPAGEGASIRSIFAQLPFWLRPRLTTLQHACVAAYLSSLTACPARSRVGDATVTSPTTRSPLSGPIDLVSHGPDSPPSLLVLLQSEGIEVKLEGTLAVSAKDVVSATFDGLPDIPISSLDLRLPRGPNSLLGATSSLCKGRMRLPYMLTDQSGNEIKGAAEIAVRGCPSRQRRPRAASTARPARTTATYGR